MAKPRKRNQTLTVRLTQAEKERIQTQAKKARRSVTDYLVALSWETPICLGPDTRPLLVELKRMGSNVNPNRPEGKRRGFHLLQLPGGGGPAGRFARRAVPPYQEQPMATVMYIPEKKQSLGAMKGVMGYVCQEKKTRDPVTGPAVCHRRPLPGGQCLSGISGHQAHLWQDEGHELLPVRAILLPQRRR